MKGMMIILDGVQDVGYPELGGKTPIDAGKGEAIRRLERESAKARFSTTPPGLEPDTLPCTLTLLGVEAGALPSGRSYLEAMAEDFPVGRDDLVMRCNFVKIAPDDTLEVPCCAPPEEAGRALLEEVRRRHSSPLKKIGDYKSLQVIPGGRRFLEGLRTYPPHNYQGRLLNGILPAGNELASALAATTLELLEKYSPYTVLNWSPSVAEEVPLFSALHGMRGGIVTKTLVLEGVARAMDMPCPDVSGATGETDTSLAAKLCAATGLLSENDFVMLHIGGTDEATHRQNPLEKAEFIARIDKELLTPLLEQCPDGTRIMLTCDHAALCGTAGHTGEPVDALLWEKGACHSGDLGILSGTRAVPLLYSENW